MISSLIMSLLSQFVYPLSPFTIIFIVCLGNRSISNNNRRSIFGDVRRKEEAGKSRFVTRLHFECPIHQGNHFITKRSGQEQPGILKRSQKRSSPQHSFADERFLGKMERCNNRTRIKNVRSKTIPSEPAEGKKVQFKTQILMHIYFATVTDTLDAIQHNHSEGRVSQKNH